jgi:glycosyltransferase involved in cell wall biosynthesis
LSTRLAVLMPTWNCQQTVAETVRSVLAQTMANFLFLCVDDGSTDGTVDEIRRAAAGDSRLQLVQQTHGGIVSALEAGRAALLSEIDYVARIDGDDWMLPTRLERQLDFLARHPRLAALGSRVRLKPDVGGMSRYVAWLNGLTTPEEVARSMFIEAPLCHPSVMLRRDWLDRVGGYRAAGWPEDYDLWLRLHAAGAAIAVLPEVLTVWRDHERRLTRTHPDYAAPTFYEIKAHYLTRIHGERFRIWNAGRDGKRLARALEARGAVVEAFIDIDPRKIGGVRRGQVPVLGPDGLGGPGDGSMILAAVGIPRARADIRARLTGRGYVEGLHFVCAA